MEGFRFIESIRLQNVLSFGPEGMELALEPLNVFIGPNGSGKSNLIEALSLFAAAPRDIQAPIRQGGGVSEWIWKGTDDPQPASVELAIVPPTDPEPPTGNIPILHRLAFRSIDARYGVLDYATRFGMARAEIPVQIQLKLGHPHSGPRGLPLFRHSQ